MRYIYIFIIGLISVYDNCLNVIYKDTLESLESNIIGQMLLKQGLDVFVEAKAVGTLFCLLLCVYISKTKYKSAIGAVCLLQVVLFCYLSFTDYIWFRPLTGDFPYVVVPHTQIDTTPVEAFIEMQMNR